MVGVRGVPFEVEFHFQGGVETVATFSAQVISIT